MSKSNCWEFKQCGRHPGGPKVPELGVCPAATHAVADGINSGRYAGRACWAVAGTLCGAVVQGTFATKISRCQVCPFFHQVRDEEGDGFKMTREIMRLIAG
jgi:hypothetical protein